MRSGAPAHRWNPYPAYKDSRVEWLGEVPEQWEIKKLKYLTRLDYGDSLPAEAREVGDVPVYGSNGSVGFHSHANTLAPALVIGRKGSFGKINYSDKPCFAIDTTYFIDSRKTQSDLRWLFFILQLLNLDSFSEDSAVPGLSREFVYDRWVPGIPLPEQRAIASFLDRQTAHLDALISKKERLIALLEEKRAALITRAVTKGLDPNVAMKDSGVEWLGEVPERWEVRKLKYIANVNLSNVDKKTNEGEDSVKLCNYVDVYYNDYITPELDFMEATASPHQIDKFALRKGDVIITKDSESWEDIAVPAYVPADIDNVICGYHLAHIRPYFANINGEYLFRSFCEARLNHQFRIEANGITRFGLGKYAIDNSLFPVPPINEQKAIASFLDRETTKIDALVAKIKDGIEKLTEYRTALISAAVTGKIDVREAV